ncbi:MAG: threonylcarbamoyl-AMP synthase [Zetaproteobacteria bacterium CG_4_9_14_3_um_filter_49_83]|nr:MAG: threonylcarbamoyl-AMP synthase [Zetaproteobacteria bacterium CG1_02_49_23]PIQ32556.1 MAG: threonylcarbamoyl-AMP synthase [Zetaproteobacteria bacterium CG17_big_fil_post_rev_8_21_14_2_50_50_13]PIV31145.1 MAG: threonylcarbamoyl-AMP synthase [Zetaproteobacteria bacterium CG02_land_8_20_14_3_00_50_9]PIY56132.1 MAG: threonylcarbamoyl-AMP synthase [Zetaproteobacteria bacterium CG_4_10_14_0_8_um_filter_49_80]PJA35913.1 MAG: threonylcarbamoyl-AMP synthase [Zetaproteobacteria bacterium CG_4_9_14
MSGFEHLRMHPDRPQIRQIKFAADMLRNGAFAIVPTETTYSIMMLPQANQAQEVVRQLRGLDKTHLWSLVCLDLSQAAQLVKMDNRAHRIVKRCLPGGYTFILPANSTLPKRVFGNRRDVGLRISSHVVCRALLETLGEPLLATTLQFPDEALIANDPEEIKNRCKHMHAVLMDVGWGGMTPTTVVDLCGDEPNVLRQGLAEWPYE